jgi:hypothetical protein
MSAPDVRRRVLYLLFLATLGSPVANACIDEDFSKSTANRPSFLDPSKDLRSLISRLGVRLSLESDIRINGMRLEVGEVSISPSQALELMGQVRDLSLREPSWKIIDLQERRWILSRWVGSLHEAISLRPGPESLSCLLNYSRQDLQRSSMRALTLPMVLPLGFSRLTSSEERTREGRVQLFTLAFAGPTKSAMQRLRTALMSSQWRLESSDERQGLLQAYPQAFVLFAERDAAHLRATVFPSSPQTRVVLQVWQRQ